MTSQLGFTEPQTTRAKRAIAAALASLVIIALMSICIKVSQSDTSPNTTVFSFSWIATVLLLLWKSTLNLNLPEKGSVNSSSNSDFVYTYKNLLLLLALGLFTTFISILWSFSLTKTSVANSDLLQTSVTPMFTTLGGWLFLGQKFNRLFVIGVGIALAGVIVIGLEDISIAATKLEGDGLAVLSAFCWAVSLLIREKLRTQFSATTLTLWCLTLNTLFLAPILLVSGDRVFPQSWSSWLSSTFIGLGEVLNMILTAYSLKWLSSALFSTILLLSPAVAAILAWAIFSETLSPLNLLGFVVILLGIYLAISSSQELLEASEEHNC